MRHDEIALTVPAKPDYFATIRLTCAAVSERAGFNIEDIEDLKTSVAEACLLLMGRGCGDKLTISFQIDDGLRISVRGKETQAPGEQSQEMEFSVHLLEMLIDQAAYQKMRDEHSYMLLKHIEGHAH